MRRINAAIAVSVLALTGCSSGQTSSNPASPSQQSSGPATATAASAEPSPQASSYVEAVCPPILAVEQGPTDASVSTTSDVDRVSAYVDRATPQVKTAFQTSSTAQMTFVDDPPEDQRFWLVASKLNLVYRSLVLWRETLEKAAEDGRIAGSESAKALRDAQDTSDKLGELKALCRE